MSLIVVGVDGSAHADVALRWAVDEADRHDATVLAVMAWSAPDDRQAAEGQASDAARGEAAAREALRTAVAGVASVRPVEQRVVCGSPVPALLGAGAAAELIVVGARGVGGFTGLLLGSVSERVVEQARTPVAVVREGAGRPASCPVVVGIDGSSASVEALRWAAAEARRRRAPLEVVHAWRIPSCGAMPTPSMLTTLQEAAQRTLDEALADPSLEGLDVGGHLGCGGAAQRLVYASQDASLVVVGTRGKGALERIVLGSTSRQLAHHAPCPLVVVPPSVAATRPTHPPDRRRSHA